MLYTVQFLCSVVAAFARLARVLRKAMASVLCSPVSVPPASPAGGVATPLSLRSKAHPVVVGVALHGHRAIKKQLSIAPPVVLAACDGGNGSAEQGETKRKAALAARRRPSRLLIPAVRDAGEAPFGEAVAVAEKEAEVEVKVEGEGFWLASRRGARHAMEDGYGVTTDKIGDESQLAFYGVYDGHGGRAAVDFVSGPLGRNVAAAVLAATGTQEAEEASSSVDAVTAAIRAAYLATDSEFQSQGARGGACAATALVMDSELYVANLGDCRVVMSYNGAATALTSDHTAAREDERVRIESSGGYVSCGSNGVWRVLDCLAVSRAFGDGSLKRWVISEPEIRRTKLTAGCEFLVIASDGLWNKVSNQEAVDAVSRSTASNSVVCCKELVEMARARGSRDDITVMVMVVDLKRFCTME